MNDENFIKNRLQRLHPWKEFLDARLKVIFWFRNERGLSDIEIADFLSMTEKQVHSIIKANEDMTYE